MAPSTLSKPCLRVYSLIIMPGNVSKIKAIVKTALSALMPLDL